MHRLVPVASQLYPFSTAMLSTALLQCIDNTPASSLCELWGPGSCLSARAVKHQEIKPNPSTPTSSTEKAVKMTLP